MSTMSDSTTEDLTMRRTLPVLFATVLGLVLLLSFHTSPESAVITAPSAGPPPTSSPSSQSTSTPAGAGPPTTGAGSSTSGGVGTSTTHTYTGRTETNRYGPVQVSITIKGTQLTNVAAVQLPSDRPHSQRLSAEAGPILRTEALQAQSARIDVVSGATFTSEGYAQSLQSALDQARVGG
jgi:uncharacterized protein with FMN-binding domain